MNSQMSLPGKHDWNVIECLASILHLSRDHLQQKAIPSLSLPLALGGLGVGGSWRIRDAAHWGSWADCLEMVRVRHLMSAEDIIGGMMDGGSVCLSAVELSATRLREVGVEIPPWEALAQGFRLQVEVADREPSDMGHCWQKHAADTVQAHHREHSVFPLLTRPERAAVRSQSGPPAAVPFTAIPVHRVSRIDPKPFRILLLRRLRMPLPLSVRTCWCGRLLDVLGHHRAACGTAGVLGRREVRRGECGGPDLPRRWSPRVYQRHVEGPRHCSHTQRE